MHHKIKVSHSSLINEPASSQVSVGCGVLACFCGVRRPRRFLWDAASLQVSLGCGILAGFCGVQRPGRFLWDAASLQVSVGSPLDVV